MSQYNENILNPIDVFVPLSANPNREIDMYGNLIRVKTQSGAFYCFDGISRTPLFYNNARIYNITSDSSGNTIYVNYYGNNNITTFRVNLQGIIYYRSDENIHYDSSGNNTSVTEGTTATQGTVTYTDNINNINNTNLFSGSIIRKKLIEQDDDLCPIKQEQIGDCDIYMNCSCCNKNFFEEEIRYWLLSKSVGNRTCPNCRGQWSNNNMYINRI
jgi:hypothetical protein